MQDQATVMELAAEIGRGPALVRTLLSEVGIYEPRTSLVGTDKQEAARDLARRYNNGESISALVRTTGIYKRMVRDMLTDEGVVLPVRRSLNRAEIDQLAMRYRAGENIRGLAESFGVGYGTVRALLLGLGVEMRPQGPQTSARLVQQWEDR